jgi:hypothetical protein
MVQPVPDYSSGAMGTFFKYRNLAIEDRDSQYVFFRLILYSLLFSVLITLYISGSVSTYTTHKPRVDYLVWILLHLAASKQRIQASSIRGLTAWCGPFDLSIRMEMMRYGSNYPPTQHQIQRTTLLSFFRFLPCQQLSTRGVLC